MSTTPAARPCSCRSTCMHVKCTNVTITLCLTPHSLVLMFMCTCLPPASLLRSLLSLNGACLQAQPCKPRHCTLIATCPAAQASTSLTYPSPNPSLTPIPPPTLHILNPTRNPSPTVGLGPPLTAPSSPTANWRACSQALRSPPPPTPPPTCHPTPSAPRCRPLPNTPPPAAALGASSSQA